MFDEIRRLTASLKVGNALTKIHGENLEAKFDEMVPFLETLNTETIPQDYPGMLKAFREDVGEEMWASIASNPAMPQMLEKWGAEKSRSWLHNIINAFREKMLPGDSGADISDQEIYHFIDNTQRDH